MKVVNIYGGPGVGKSTTAAGLFYQMKIRQLNVELVTEYAKDLVWEGRLESMLDQQDYLFAKQNRRLHILRDKVDYVITDSPILLSCVYPEVNRRQFGTELSPAASAFDAFVKGTYETYDNINFRLLRGKSQHQAEGRLQDVEQSSEVDEMINETLVGITPYRYLIDVDENTISSILDILNIK